MRVQIKQKERGLVPLYPNENSPVLPIAQKAYIIKLFIFLVALCISPAVYSWADEKLTYESEVVKIEPELVSITPVESSVVRKITPESEVKKKVVQSTVKQLIDKHFEGEDAKVAYAIIKAESSGNIKAVGYNCFYTEDGTVHESRVQGAKSTHCKKGHQQYSHSVDCGLAQISFKGKSCPQKAFDPEWNIAEMKRYHDTRGWSPWVAYTMKRHLAYME